MLPLYPYCRCILITTVSFYLLASRGSSRRRQEENAGRRGNGSAQPATAGKRARRPWSPPRRFGSANCSPLGNTHVRSPRSIAGRPRRSRPICWARSISTGAGLQQRLVYEAGGRQGGPITLLVCEHPPLITIGRSGSRAHLRVRPPSWPAGKSRVRWVNRGGGA